MATRFRRRKPATEPPAPVPEVARYEVLATALAGRRLAVVPGIGTAYTDGESVFVTDDGAARTQVIVHALLVGHGSLVKAVLNELRGRPEHAARYLLAEVNRLCAADGPWSPLRHLIGVPEGIPETASPQEAVQLATGVAHLPPTPAEWGTIRPGLLLRRIDDGFDLESAEEGSGNLEVGDEVQEVDEDQPEDVSKILRALSSPLGSKAISRMLQKLLGMGRSSTKGSSDGEVGGDEAEQARGAKPGATGGKERPEVSWRAAAGGALAVPVALGYRYPEWDVKSNSYRPSWCTVIDRPPEPSDGDRSAVIGRDLVMRRRLAKIGLSPQIQLRQPLGDDLDLDAAVRAQIAVASGGSPEENVYAAHRAHRRSLSVLVLLDVSGSTKDPSPSGARVFDRQQEAGAVLIDSLTALGARTAAYAFHSQGRHAVHMLRVKTFNETWSQSAHQRMACLDPGGYTRLGAAVRHGSTLLSRETAASRRLLVVLSDGVPYDTEYQDAYAEADSRRALAEAQHEMIGCLCITIGAPATDVDALADVFGSAAHSRVPDLGHLRTIAPQLFLHGLNTSDSRRRVSRQGREFKV